MSGVLILAVDLPYDAASVAGSHAGATAVIAGFALTAFVFVLRSDGLGRPLAIAEPASLLITAAALAAIASWMFSSLSGDNELSAYIMFVGPSTVYGLAAVVLLAGVVLLVHERIPVAVLPLRVLHVLLLPLLTLVLWSDAARSSAAASALRETASASGVGAEEVLPRSINVDAWTEAHERGVPLPLDALVVLFATVGVGVGVVLLVIDVKVLVNLQRISRLASFRQRLVGLQAGLTYLGLLCLLAFLYVALIAVYLTTAVGDIGPTATTSAPWWFVWPTALMMPVLGSSFVCYTGLKCFSGPNPASSA